MRKTAKVRRPPSNGAQPPTYVGAGQPRRYPTVHVVENPRTRRRRLVGRNIQLARRRAGISQQQLAQRLDMDRSDLSQWETGKHEPSPGNLERLATELELPTWWFYQPHDEDDLT